MMPAKRPRLLIEDWLPAAAIGVECIRERSTGQQPPDKRLHVWWARRPLVISRAAVLASLLPPDFPRDVFDRLLGFWGCAREVLAAHQMLEWAGGSGSRIRNPHGQRAFKGVLREVDVRKAHGEATGLWGKDILVLDPMAGGGSIPLESARLGFATMANEYNPVACSIMEAIVDYPLRFGEKLARTARHRGAQLRERFNKRIERLYPRTGFLPPHCYIFARTVPCPDTQHATPLVPDWHVLKPARHRECGAECLLAVPAVDAKKGTWRVERFAQGGRGAGQLRQPPRPTYAKGNGVSLFTGRLIPSDYIKAMAQQGRMGSALYAVVVKGTRGLMFQPPAPADLAALEEAEKELARLRPQWEKADVIPTELYPEISSDPRPRLYGMRRWADMFSPRQLLAMGVLVEELRRLRPEILEAEGPEVGEAIIHLLALAVDKFVNHNCILTRWHSSHAVIAAKMDRHDYAFKATYAEMAVCNSGAGLDWAIGNVLEAYEEIARLPRADEAKPAEVTLGSATALPQLADGSITAVVVDPPYAENVQYSELADFFYVWLKRTQGHRRPEWFSTYLCEHDQEAVANISRHRGGAKAAKQARQNAYALYQRLMTDTFRECRRVLRDDGVLTVMFTHKKQEAWEKLFEALIEAGFTITATWPVKTESEHSLHIARKNSAQSTVLLVARKRPEGAEVGYFDRAMQAEIRERARATAERLRGEGLNPVDQLVGTFGPVMEVFSRYAEVRTDTGEPVPVGRAIQAAADAVSEWRIQQLAERGLNGVEAEGQFVLLCWDVLGAAEFRFNEAHLLGKAVGMEVDRLVAAGLVTREGENIRMVPARERRRERALEPDEVAQTLFGLEALPKRRTKKDILKVHPNDPEFRTTIDACHALALRYIEAGGGAGGTGSAKALARQQRWTKESPVARLMEALVKAAPQAVRFEHGARSVAARFPEFRAWHELLEPLFGIAPPEWKEEKPKAPELPFEEGASSEEDEAIEDEGLDDEGGEGEA